VPTSERICGWVVKGYSKSRLKAVSVEVTSKSS